MSHGGSHVVHSASTSRSSGSGSSSYSTGGGSSTYVDNSYNRGHGRVGEPKGSHVVHSKPAGSHVTSKGGASLSGDKSHSVYEDNAQNRKVGRVGKPIGTHVVHKDGSVTTSEDGEKSQNSASQRVYADNPLNRKYHRVGKPIGTHVVHKDGSVTKSTDGKPVPRHKPRRKELVDEHTLEELVRILEDLRVTDETRPDYQDAVDQLERQQIEDSWMESGITPSTDDTCLIRETPGMIIPFHELKVEAEIGRGGFGVVCAALWKNTPVAFKRLLLQQMSTKRKEAFVKEVTIMASLKHSGVVKLFGAVVEKAEIGIVMEYLARSLFEAIFKDDETEFSEDNKKQIVTQVSSALDYLHTHNPSIVHCDVKSANVLLDKNNNAKLGDFGLSVIKTATETSTSSVAGVYAAPGQGTPRYSAPEVLRGEKLIMDQLIKTDIYSLAIVVFELVTETEAYEGLNKRQLEVNVGDGNWRPTSDEKLIDVMSQPVTELLNQCWDGCAINRPVAGDFQQKWSSITDLYT